MRTFFERAYERIRKMDGELLKIIAGAVVFAIALILDLCRVDVAAVIFYIISFLIVGAEVVVDAVISVIHRNPFDEKFLMSTASVCALIIGSYAEGTAVMLFYLVGDYFEKKAVHRSRLSIKALMDICPDKASVIRDGKEMTVPASEVKVGETLVIRPGDRFSVDCRVEEGESDTDTSPITGESVPRPVAPGDEVQSGCLNINGMLKCISIREQSESAASRILSMIEEASENKSKEEDFITSFSRYYTPAVVICAVLLAFIPPLLSMRGWVDSIRTALTFLVVSCPCALVISVPLAFFGGIGGAAAKGILYKGGSSFADMAGANIAVFDKTGTLTSGEFEIADIYAEDGDTAVLLNIAAAAETGSNHPVALCIRKMAEGELSVSGLSEFPGKGVSAVIGTERVLVGNRSLMEQENVRVDMKIPPNSVIVARDGRFAGYITVKDRIKPEARSAIAELIKLGFKKTVILTGDREENAVSVKRELGINELHASMLPDDKYKYIKKLSGSSDRVMYVGDGINDAPTLTAADVGVAMGGIGSEAAIEAADLVITSGNLSKLPEAVKTARSTIFIAKTNIIFALTVKIAMLILGAAGVVGMWGAVVADVGVSIVAILNSMRTLKK